MVESSQRLIPEKVKELAQSEDAPAMAIYTAAKNLLGPMIDAWEPESIAIELKSLGLLLSDFNMEKILMCSSLHRLHHEAFTSYNTFKNIVMVFNSEQPLVDQHEKLTVEQLAWGIEALKKFLMPNPLYFDYEPLQFGGSILFEEGYFVAPKELEIFQDELTKRNKNKEMEEETRKAKVEGSQNDIVREQLLKLERVEKYVAHMREELDSAMQHVSHGQ